MLLCSFGTEMSPQTTFIFESKLTHLDTSYWRLNVAFASSTAFAH